MAQLGQMLALNNGQMCPVYPVPSDVGHEVDDARIFVFGSIDDSLDVITENLVVTFGASLAEYNTVV